MTEKKIGCKLSWGLIGSAMYDMYPQIDERRNTEILLFIALIIKRSRIAYTNPMPPPLLQVGVS